MSILSRLSSIPGSSSMGNIGKQIILRQYIAGVLIAVMAGGGYWWIYGADDATTSSALATVVPVERQNITTTVDAVGTVTFANEQQLKFTQKGTVNKVNAKEGDHVTKGQILAELDKTSVLTDVRQSALGVSASALQLQQLQNEKNKTILDAQNAVNETERQFEQAKNNLEVTKQQLPSDIASAERTLSEREASLEQAKLDLEKTIETEMQNLGATAQDILVEGNKLLDSLYGTLTMNLASRPSSGNDTLEIHHFLYNNPALKQQVEWSYYNAVNAADDMYEAYGSSLLSEDDADVILQALTDAQTLAENVHKLAEDTYAMLQGAVTDNSSFTPAELQSSRNTVSANRSTSAGLIQDAQTAQSNLLAASDEGGVPSVTLKQKQDAVQSAENALQDAQENLSILQTKTPGDLASQEAALIKLQEDYQSKQEALGNTTKSVDIQIQLKRNDVAQKSATLQKAQKGVEDYQIVAPFDGIISRMDFKVGDNLLADTGEEAYVVLQNRDFLLVTVQLDQVDIVRIKEGMPATAELDAVPGRSFSGSIAAINPTAIVTSGVVSYEVDIKIPMPADLTLLSGMTASVKIETAKRENVLVVPNLAISHKGSIATVKLADGTEAEIVTGVTDGRNTEVISGVSEGQSVQSVNVVTGGSTTPQGATPTNGGAVRASPGGGPMMF